MRIIFLAILLAGCTPLARPICGDGSGPTIYRHGTHDSFSQTMQDRYGVIPADTCGGATHRATGNIHFVGSANEERAFLIGVHEGIHAAEAGWSHRDYVVPVSRCGIITEADEIQPPFEERQ